jgi:hypothetical protein
VISAAKNSNKFQKTRFWKEKLVEDVVTFGLTAQTTLVTYKLRNKLSLYVQTIGALSPQESLLILLCILRLVFGPIFNPKYVINMNNYG